MFLWCLHFLPKNELKQSTSSKIEFVRSFFGRNVGLKKSFRIRLTFSIIFFRNILYSCKTIIQQFPSLLMGLLLFETIKGQTNSKLFFQAKVSSKNEQTNSTLLLVDLFSFVFWKKVKTPKRHFEINWHLVVVACPRILMTWNTVRDAH